jgi:hypothetical protein
VEVDLELAALAAEIAGAQPGQSGSAGTDRAGAP